MQYDANGVRYSKVVPTNYYTTTTSYFYDGNKLAQEKVIVAGMGGNPSTTYKTYLYNSQGIIGFAIGSTVYTYRKNLFGDIIAIYQGATKKAAYVYDAWGNCTITQDTDGIGTANPFRYRGYYWDNDLQLYYLMSRYYDPATGRFINADSLEYLDPKTIGGLNLYAYCGNNPVMCVDPTGHIAWWLIGLAIVAASTRITSAGENIAYWNSERIYEKYKEKITITNGRIKNSSEVTNPFHIWALSAYVKYHTDSGVEGSSYGLAIEWICHNLGYHFLGMESGKDLDFGKTLHSDFESHHSIDNIGIPILMSAIELLTNPLFFLSDLWRSF